MWAIEKVVYEDGSENVLDSGNFVEIDAQDVVEIFATAGKRRHGYVRKGDVLSLDSGSTWMILEQAESRLRIQTPIGQYHLRRDGGRGPEGQS